MTYLADDPGLTFALAVLFLAVIAGGAVLAVEVAAAIRADIADMRAARSEAGGN
ncbi:hypothetical protein ACUIAC_01730 [Dermabacteraceae bacterium P13138]